MTEKPCRPPMTTGGWLAQEDDEIGELIRDCRRITSRMEIDAPGWAAPIYWLESLSRARWWAWLRRRIAKWID